MLTFELKCGNINCSYGNRARFSTAEMKVAGWGGGGGGGGGGGALGTNATDVAVEFSTTILTTNAPDTTGKGFKILALGF